MTINDKDIICAMREDAEKGFRLLMKSYKEPLYWHIRRLVVSHDDAQDATQETFIRIFRSFEQYSEANSLRAWLFRIATNEALRLLGRQKNATMLSLDDVTADMLSTKANAYHDSSDALVVRLQKAILHLPAKQQLAFNLRYYDELSYDEIAEVAGSSAASVKMNYHLSRPPREILQGIFEVPHPEADRACLRIGTTGNAPIGSPSPPPGCWWKESSQAQQKLMIFLPPKDVCRNIMTDIFLLSSFYRVSNNRVTNIKDLIE